MILFTETEVTTNAAGTGTSAVGEHKATTSGLAPSLNGVVPPGLDLDSAEITAKLHQLAAEATIFNEHDDLNLQQLSEAILAQTQANNLIDSGNAMSFTK